ncbi:hypothetical protein HDU81_007702 [Chytriomyces hyalinus]|nr:hypothetical protein HDU81_007702 [Chytriomyces hyalinus]
MSVSYQQLASTAVFNASFVCANYTPAALAQVDMNTIDYSLLIPLIHDHVPGFMLDMIHDMAVHSTTVEAMSVTLQEIFENPAILVKIPFFIHFQFFGYELNIPEVLLRQSSESFMRSIATYGPYLGYYSNLCATILSGILLLSFLGFVAHYEILKQEDSRRTIFTVFNNSLFLGIAGVFIQAASLTKMTYDLLYRFYDQRAIRISGMCVISSTMRVIFLNRVEVELADGIIKLASGAVETLFDLLFAFCCTRALQRLTQDIGVNPKVKTISAHGLFASASQLLAYVCAILPDHAVTGIDENSVCFSLSIFFLVFAFAALFSMKVRLHFMKGTTTSQGTFSSSKDANGSKVENGVRTSLIKAPR